MAEAGGVKQPPKTQHIRKPFTVPVAGKFVQVPYGGTYYSIIDAVGVVQVAVGEDQPTVCPVGEVRYMLPGVEIGKDSRYLAITSDTPGDVVTVEIGYGKALPLDTVITTISGGGFRMYVGQNPAAPKVFNTDDGKNLSAAPNDTVGGGSAVPGGTFGTILVGETFVAIRLDAGTYVSGASGQPAIETAGGGSAVPAEMVDMTTGQLVTSISDPGTWYRIKTQGASLLTIPVGTIVGNTPVTQAFNFALERGYSTWQDPCPQISGPYVLPTITDANPHYTPAIVKPKTAKGCIIWIDGGTFDPGASPTLISLMGNPATGNFPTAPGAIFGFGSYNLTNGGPQGWFCNADAHSLSSSGSPASLSYGLSMMGALSKVGIIDSNATPGTPDTGITFYIEWVY